MMRRHFLHTNSLPGLTPHLLPRINIDSSPCLHPFQEDDPEEEKKGTLANLVEKKEHFLLNLLNSELHSYGKSTDSRLDFRDIYHSIFGSGRRET